MVAKKGRPVSENKKDYMLRVRMDKETLSKLDACCETENKTRSEIVRKGIEEQYDRIEKEWQLFPAKVRSRYSRHNPKGLLVNIIPCKPPLGNQKGGFLYV